MQEDAIIFNASDDTEILKLTEEGMFYKGVLVADAGEAYLRFCEWLDHTDQSVFVPDEIFELELEEEKETE